jgi:endonuclease YncB( thermonuclease family)
MRFAWIILLCFCGMAWSQTAGTLQAKVTRVTDGDSLWLEPLVPGAPVELRLEGIDAPEICQAWGPQARQALAELVLGQQVSVKTVGRDMHGRTLGTVYLGTQNINKTLVQEGHAWSTRYKYDRGPYVADERMARALSRGLNRDGGAVMPRDFRRLNGPCLTDGAAQAAAAQAAPAAAQAAPAARSAPLAPVAVAPPARTAYRCDGRTYCSQMSSCQEATWFLQHCPGVKMDGNHDGVPCEKQWCRP